MKFIFLISQIWAISIWATICQAAQIFRTDIEPSDLLYSNNVLYVIDDGGGILTMDQNGQNRKYLSIGDYDLEAITNIPSDTNHLYVGVESPATILKVNKATGTIIEKKVLLAYPNDSESGMESLQYVPKLDTFLAGSQATGYVYLYKNRNGSLKVYCRFKPYGGSSDLSSISLKNDIMYFLYDSSKTLLSFSLKSITTDNMCQIGSHKNFLKRKNISNSDAEGIAFSPQYAFVAQDSGEVYRYTLSEFENLS